ncbi:MAG: hypothetical protein DMG05_17930 [Acidobacteria bacterium]|nr:MAG: hypothetical protein DMG05_17930 [Acidobacteriota bacterium]
MVWIKVGKGDTNAKGLLVRLNLHASFYFHRVENGGSSRGEQESRRQKNGRHRTFKPVVMA